MVHPEKHTKTITIPNVLSLRVTTKETDQQQHTRNV